jgi:hypothetical protein
MNSLKRTNTEETEDEALDDQTSAFLRADAIIDCINKQLPSGLCDLPKLDPKYVFKRRDAKVVSAAMHAVFENLGGVPAMLIAASRDPQWFYTLWAKVGQSETGAATGNTYVFTSAIPTNDLDRVDMDSDGFVVVDAQVSSLDQVPD